MTTAQYTAILSRQAAVQADRLERLRAKQDGHITPSEPPTRLAGSALERKFKLCWLGIKGPPLAAQHRFHPARRWKFDFAHPVSKVAIEIEGGVWTGGRHTRGNGFVGDCEKYNAAASLGWRIFRLTAGMIGVEACEQIRAAIERR